MAFGNDELQFYRVSHISLEIVLCTTIVVGSGEIHLLEKHLYVGAYKMLRRLSSISSRGDTHRFEERGEIRCLLLS